MEEDVTLGGKDIVQYADDIAQNYALEIYVILLMSQNKFNKKLKRNDVNYLNKC